VKKKRKNKEENRREENKVEERKRKEGRQGRTRIGKISLIKVITIGCKTCVRVQNLCTIFFAPKWVPFSPISHLFFFSSPNWKVPQIGYKE